MDPHFESYVASFALGYALEKVDDAAAMIRAAQDDIRRSRKAAK